MNNRIIEDEEDVYVPVKKKTLVKKTRKTTPKKIVDIEPVVKTNKDCNKCKRPSADNGKGVCRLCGCKL